MSELTRGSHAVENSRFACNVGALARLLRVRDQIGSAAAFIRSMLNRLLTLRRGTAPISRR